MFRAPALDSDSNHVSFAELSPILLDSVSAARAPHLQHAFLLVSEARTRAPNISFPTENFTYTMTFPGRAPVNKTSAVE